MALNTYIPTEWVNNQAPAINSTNLNNIEDGIVDAMDNINQIIDGTLPIEGTSNISIGSIFLHGSQIVPDGYLKCDGAAVSRTTYVDLFNTLGTIYGSGNGTTTFNVPDMRGYFARGWDDGRGIDGGRAIGTLQDDEIKAHHHNLKTQTQRISIHDISQELLGTSASASDKGLMSDAGGSETRPKNIALPYYIKY